MLNPDANICVWAAFGLQRQLLCQLLCTKNAKTVAAQWSFPRSTMWRSMTHRWRWASETNRQLFYRQIIDWDGALTRMEHSAALNCSNDKARADSLSAHLGRLKVLHLALFPPAAPQCLVEFSISTSHLGKHSSTSRWVAE